MKSNRTLAALGCALFTITLAEAKTITVDNKVGSVAMHTSAQAACNAAEPGDTILIAGSPTSYGHVDLRKKLHLVGPGYWLQENNIPGETKNSAFLSIHFGEVELSSAASSSITGMQLTYLGVSSGVGGISVDKCHLQPPGPIPVEGPVAFRRSYISANLRIVPGGSMRNCVMNGLAQMDSGTTANNCLFTTLVSAVPGSSISSSIFLASDPVHFSQHTKGSVTHSLLVGGLGVGGKPGYLPSGAGNNPTIAFTVEAFVQNQLHDKAYLLAAGSPAIGTGLNGVDIGIFGGAVPYVISGVPSLPRITRLQVPATATSASGLQIEVDAESF